MTTLDLRGSALSFIASMLLAAAAVAASACGSSSQTETVTAPTSTKCALQLTADGLSFPAAGGSGSVRIATTRDCQWTAKTDVAWLAIGQPATGQGEGSVPFTVSANSDPASRTAGIAVNEQHFDITQAGKPCEFTLSSNHESVDSAGGDLSVSVRATASSCAWTASSGVSWISIAGSRDGRGNGTITFHVDPVTGPPRSGNLTIAGQNVQVDQGTGCTYAIGSDTIAVDAAGGDRQVAVAAGAGCGWTAQSQASWITIASGASGTGSGIVTVHVIASDGPGRSGTLIVAGRTVTVTQSLACTYAITPSSVNVGAQANTAAVHVDAGAGCAWTATSTAPWITISTGANGTGRAQVQITISANDGPARSATITVAGRSLSIAQASGCTYTVAPSSQDVPGNGGNVVVSVTTGAACGWTASSSVDWITVPDGGAGSGQATFSVKPNASAPRTGSITIAGRTVTVNQASQCRWFFAPQSHDLPASGGNGNVLVIVTGACSWTAVPNVPWIQITAGGSGTGGGLLQFVVPSNPGASRTGFILIGGESYVVHQAGTGDQ